MLGQQINYIAQDLLRLHSPYSGPNSLWAYGDREMSQAYGVYVGGRFGTRLQAYLDVEWIAGNGISGTTGLAGPSDGDVLRQGSIDLPKIPYIARAFLRYVVPLGGPDVDTLAAAPDQGALAVSARRLELTAGKLAVTDLIDVNRYAGSTRLQFQNWSLFQNTAWDYAADTRGYSVGVAAAWIERRWALRAASFLMPTFANGNILDWDVAHAHGDQVEVTLGPANPGTVVRVMAYANHARMGRYAAAILVAQQTGQPPNIVKDDAPGRTKYGVGVNLEQPLADSGETGLFARFGWADGTNEDFVFTEVDRHASVGIQVAGTHWRRGRDVVGIGFVDHGLSDVHREYLALGGLGFLLGDGRLRYGHERIVEAYYRLQLGPWVQLSPDVQEVWNPGYNQDRGPATILGLRLNVRH
ncbi:MAG TPA: carbohydrate porin [Gemmatimonadales bacterium]|nr:carbohydrate porin [Gemmatimonadales bacterium]